MQDLSNILKVIGIIAFIIGAALSLVSMILQEKRKKLIMSIKDFKETPSLKKDKRLTYVRIASLTAYLLSFAAILLAS